VFAKFQLLNSRLHKRHPHAHTAIYFADPDGNSIELIAPFNLDMKEGFPMMTLEQWLENEKV